MRVLHLYTRLNAGGPARMARDVLPHLGERGVESLVATGACPPREPSWEEEVRAASWIAFGGMRPGWSGWALRGHDPLLWTCSP